MTAETSRKLRVLYVEDAFDQALLVKAFFNRLPNCAVTHAQDGDQALKLIETQPWDLLVADLNLPGTDGFTLVRRLREVSGAVPVIVTTGYTQAQYEEQALRAGADQVMIKPLDGDDFVQRVLAMIEKSDGPVFAGDSNVVIALGGRLGDVEMGCGGSLLRAVDEGRQVIVVALLDDEKGATQAELKAAKVAADILGVELRMEPSMFGDEAGQASLVGGLVEELRPSTVYLPSRHEQDAPRQGAARLARPGLGDVPSVLSYETATTGLAFAPSLFIDVQKQMMMKMEALSAYQAVGVTRVDLRPRMAQAYARYWGRFKDFQEVEAFEDEEEEG